MTRQVVAHLPIDKIALDYLAGMRSQDMALRYGVSVASIARAVERSGVPKRPYTREGCGDRQPRGLVRIYRDPCPWCGIRGDLGCSHRWKP